MRQAVYFCADGIWIEDGTDNPVWLFSGSALELISILIYHREMDLESAQFYVVGIAFDDWCDPNQKYAGQ